MAPTLALRFLSFVLFFFMNDHGIGASRDLKVELRDQKQVDLYGTTPVSKAEPYITGSKTTPDSTQANYVASYTFMKQNHPSHHGKLNHPYITGYKTSTHQVNEPYLTGYRTTGAHETNQPANYITEYRTSTHDSHEANQPNYITAYKTSTHDSNKPYITGYKTSSAHEANQPSYITAYKASTHDSNEPYITGYKASGAHEANQPNYITAYRTSTHDSNEPYITGYKTSGAHEANQPYIAGNKPTAHDSSQHARDATEPYITKYGRIGPKKDQKELSAQDHNKPYITQYGDPYAAKRGSMHFSINRKSGQDLEESKGGPSSNVDHTEAFKTGFFSLDDLYGGNTMTLQFPVQEISNFLPRKEADSIPFSMSQLPSVLQLFSISEDSPQAKSMRDTLEQCEAETITGETKICANSLESMLDFIGTIIGSETKYDILTTSHPTTSGASLQKYTILEVSQDIYAPKWVACHPLPYPYAIYYCHFIATGSKVFKVLLGGENGDKIEALGICHLDTSDWSPNHILFRQLGIKPGEAPVCHFFPVKHLMWVPQPSKANM